MWLVRLTYQTRAYPEEGELYGIVGAHDWAAAGSLVKLNDVGAATTDEVRQLLVTHFNSRHGVSPRQFAEIVGSIYKDLGFYVRITGCRGDGGLDVVLDGPGGKIIGVQVKRWQGTVGVSEIREFTGALILKGMTTGIFVTTSDFTRGAREAAGEAARRGVPVTLVNATAFYAALGIAQRKAYTHADDTSAPFYNAKLTWLDSNIDDLLY